MLTNRSGNRVTQAVLLKYDMALTEARKLASRKPTDM